MTRTINIARLEHTMRHLERHPERYVPAVWGLYHPSIGVIADFGGWTVLLQDPRQLPPPGEPDGAGGWTVHSHWTIDGTWMPAVAQKMLGLDEDQRAVLFHRDLTLGAARAVVDVLTASYGTVTGHRLAAEARHAGAPYVRL